MAARWQVVHCAVIVTLECTLAGVQDLKPDLWQVSHAAVVCTWLLGLPVAVLPLWQVAQLPGVTLVCLNEAGIQAVVRWHVSHAAVVCMWFAGLPEATLLL